MKSSKRVLTNCSIIVLILLLMGCEEEVMKVHYTTLPQGGTICRLPKDQKLVDGDKELLEANEVECWQDHVDLWYPITEKNQEDGFLDVTGFEISWPTGPKRQTNRLITIPVSKKAAVKVTFVQPGHESTSVSNVVNELTTKDASK